MPKILREIRIKQLRLPEERDLEKEMEWLCQSLGIISERDRDRSSFKIFHLLVNAAKERRELTINEISEIVGLSRTSVVHHLKQMEESGIIFRRSGRVELREFTLYQLVDEIEKDFQRSLERIKKVAKEIDKLLNIS